MKAKNDKDTNDYNQLLSDKRIKHLIEMLAIKRDANMTRIYSAISATGSKNQTDLQAETQKP